MQKASPINNFRRQTAKRLRANTTQAEQRLWKMLRDFPIRGTHFRRQVPIGPYVADFACLASRLIVEIDGSQHGDAEGTARDQIRTNWLNKEGYKVIRLWNNDLETNPVGVLELIYANMYGSVDAEAVKLIHLRHRKAIAAKFHPTPARGAR
ncbi:MAG: endonuclease domain-containing protein, partial [Xanthobacteraceae bacterium]